MCNTQGFAHTCQTIFYPIKQNLPTQGNPSGRRISQKRDKFLAMDQKRELLRHTVATLAYRARRALEDSPESFAGFEGTGKRPDVILAHMGDLFKWGLSIAQGNETWYKSTPLPWAAEQKRFFADLAAFDAYLASDAPLHATVERLFQGPVADALTHVGQLSMMRRLASCQSWSENFSIAKITAGQIEGEFPEAVRRFKS